MLIALTVACAATVALAQTEVRSKNAVGYIKIPVVNDFTSLTIPFDDMNGGKIMFTNAIGTQVFGAGAQVFEWTGAAWQPYNWQNAALGWRPANSLELKPGVSYFIKRPTAWATDGQSHEIVLSGEVPEMYQSSAIAFTGSGNLTAFGFSYPVSVMFTNTALAKNFGGTGAQVFEWTGTAWQPYNWQNAALGWRPANSLELKPGVGYFFKTATASAGGAWVQERPYTWPNDGVFE